MLQIAELEEIPQWKWCAWSADTLEKTPHNVLILDEAVRAAALLSPLHSRPPAADKAISLLDTAGGPRGADVAHAACQRTVPAPAAKSGGNGTVAVAEAGKWGFSQMSGAMR